MINEEQLKKRGEKNQKLAKLNQKQGGRMKGKRLFSDPGGIPSCPSKTPSYFSIASERRKTFRRADWSDRKHSCKESLFFHTESLTQGKIFSNNSAVNSQCLQGHFFFVSFLFFSYFVLMDVIIVSLQTFWDLLR